jgi:prepilin-type N-terminal cleavage/methylation domain-containing protein
MEEGAKAQSRKQGMGNSEFEIQNDFPRPKAYRLRPAFTLVEMLVAVAMGAMLVAAAATVFKLAGEAVGTSKANTQVNSQLRVLFSWLQRDFDRIRLDGPLVIMISPDIDYALSDGSYAQADRIAFLASGDFASMSQSGVNTALAWIVYGHGDAVDSLPATPTADQMSELVLARLALLYVAAGETSGDVVAGVSFADILNDWFNVGGPWDLGTLARPNVDSLRYTHMLSHVLSFKIVRYYMASTDTEYTVWQRHRIHNTVTFGPGDEKPAWIEFEVVLRDSNGRLEEGFTGIYRVNLPSR